MSDFSFEDMCLDTLTIYANPLVLGSGMGYSDSTTRTAKHTAWPCTIQSATSAQSPGDEKVADFANMDVASTFVAIGYEVLDDLDVADFAVDGNGDEYEIRRWDAPGGNNPVGTVFLIILKKRGS